MKNQKNTNLLSVSSFPSIVADSKTKKMIRFDFSKISQKAYHKSNGGLSSSYLLSLSVELNSSSTHFKLLVVVKIDRFIFSSEFM